MKKQHFIPVTIIALGVISFTCLIGYFLALNDVFHDYASPRIFQENADLIGTHLPTWTQCSSEWQFIPSFVALRDGNFTKIRMALITS